MKPEKTKKHKPIDCLKKSYSSPLITHFGTIRELTSGGSTGMVEGMAMSVNRRT